MVHKDVQEWKLNPKAIDFVDERQKKKVRGGRERIKNRSGY